MLTQFILHRLQFSSKCDNALNKQTPADGKDGCRSPVFHFRHSSLGLYSFSCNGCFIAHQTVKAGFIAGQRDHL